jgi:hypothetical protein
VAAVALALIQGTLVPSMLISKWFRFSSVKFPFRLFSCRVYQSTTCSTDQILATNGYPNGLCLSNGVGSTLRAWPNQYFYGTNTLCQGTPTVTTSLNTTCGQTSVIVGTTTVQGNGKNSQVDSNGAFSVQVLDKSIIIVVATSFMYLLNR